MNKLKVLLSTIPCFNSTPSSWSGSTFHNKKDLLGDFNRDFNKISGYALYPPVQLATIAASVLKNVDDVEIEILDLDFEIMRYFKENEDSSLSAQDFMKKLIAEKMADFQPDVYGISSIFSSTHENLVAVANIIKGENPATQVVCGGNHATFNYKKILEECSSMDFVFLYEGDSTFLLFLEYLKGAIKFEDLRGIAWMDKATNSPILAPYEKLSEALDQLPIPKWDLVPLKEYQKYGRVSSVHSYGNKDLPSYIMQTVRGCVAACTFCSVRSFYGREVRAYSAKRVLKEIDYLYNELGITQLEIIDDDFTYNKERTIEFCNGLIKRNYNLVWNLTNGIRLGTINEEVMHAMVGAKCRSISVGVESGNDVTLAIIRKPLSIDMLHKKAELFRQFPDLYVKGNYIVGFPWENDEQMMQTFKVAEELCFDWSKFALFTPLAGTPLFQKLEDEDEKDFDFDSNNYRPEMGKKDFDEAQKYRDAIEKQVQMGSLFHNEEEKRGEEHTAKEREIAYLTYLKNLEINFIKNKNLNGGNLDRAIRDFDAVVKFIHKDHAIAHYALAKAYCRKGDDKLVRQHMDRVLDILADPMHEKWVGYFDKIVPKNEMNEMKEFSSKGMVQV
jgi:anaerobic magnesium-protoporphyrin IX monomethyl ester cyclase